MTMGITSPTSTTGQILKDGTPVISFDANNNATFAGTVVSNTPLGMRNRIINGGMVIDQRNAGASVSISGLINTYTLDRWVIRNDTEAVVSVQQSSIAPTDFNNSLLYTVTTADTSLGATQNHSVQHRIEGYNMADLGWGTANAKTITLSFWVRSSLTGTFGGAISNSAANRSYPFTYTISAANTWEQKTITIAGDTSGTWLTTNGIGAYLYFSTGAGSTISGTAGAWAAADYRSATGATSVVGTNGATFYITGVQLEKGSTATSFDYRPYGTELALCQRYLPAFNSTGTNTYIASCVATSTTNARVFVPFMTQVRTPPTGISISSASHFGFTGTSNATASAVAIVGVTQPNNCGAIDITTTALTAGQAGAAYFNNASGQLLFTGCEL